MRTCTVCKVEKDNSFFRYRKAKGWDSWCNPCRIAKLRNHPYQRESVLLSSYRKDDRRKGFENDLTMEYMHLYITTQPCFYCESTQSIGCDRIDNDKGHTKSNILPCCSVCNMIRGNTFSVVDMYRIAQFIKTLSV